MHIIRTEAVALSPRMTTLLYMGLTYLATREYLLFCGVTVHSSAGEASAILARAKARAEAVRVLGQAIGEKVRQVFDRERAGIQWNPSIKATIGPE